MKHIVLNVKLKDKFKILKKSLCVMEDMQLKEPVHFVIVRFFKLEKPKKNRFARILILLNHI